MKVTAIFVFLALLPSFAVNCAEPPVATFSIVAYDPETKELGVAVQSRFIGVGAVVPFAKANVGAVATQAWANVKYGPEVLKLLEEGKSPEQALKAVTDADDKRDLRQLGIVNAQGESANFTGAKCMDWAGGVKGPNYCCQGNILAGEAVVKAMEKTFLETKGELGARLIAALQAGQDAGGDKRGMQSAALLIVREGWGYGGSEKYRDVRVDDHEQPIAELRRVYEKHCTIFPKPEKKKAQ